MRSRRLEVHKNKGSEGLSYTNFERITPSTYFTAFLACKNQSEWTEFESYIWKPKQYGHRRSATVLAETKPHGRLGLAYLTNPIADVATDSFDILNGKDATVHHDVS